MSDRRYSTDPNRRCERCGSAVSTQFVRVFGTENAVHGCLDCLTRHQLAIGEAAIRPDVNADTGNETVGTYLQWDRDGRSSMEER
ncbi:DUF7563 family protein [Halorubrum sp. DTA98]|uniref:DUF7563 family protein n=1 Tax=Halorubrum sp. DTA98 TaxID=3402163 RepID=UPI003AAB425C